MAWYAIMKKIGRWRMNTGFDPVFWYSKVYKEAKRAAYEEWYNSLTEEEKEEMRRKSEEERKRARAEVMRLWGILNATYSYIYNSMVSRRGW